MWPSGRRYVSNRLSNVCAMCIGFMISIATPFKEFYADHHQIQVLDTPGYQDTELQVSGVFVVAHRREGVVLKFASFDEGGISRQKSLDVLEAAPIGE
jgi:hypothetical protein